MDEHLDLENMQHLDLLTDPCRLSAAIHFGSGQIHVWMQTGEIEHVARGGGRRFTYFSRAGDWRRDSDIVGRICSSRLSICGIPPFHGERLA